MNEMNQNLKKQIIYFKRKDLKHTILKQRQIINRLTGKRIIYNKYQFKYLKKYNKECASNLGKGKKCLLSKNELIIWCELNNIKCKKSLKYCEIVKLLINI